MEQRFGRYNAFGLCILLFILAAVLHAMGKHDGLALIVFGALILLGIYDLLQTRHAILRNYPVLGHMRFLLEFIRPEIRHEWPPPVAGSGAVLRASCRPRHA